MLPIPDLNENTFSKSDALALGKLNSFLLHLFSFFCNLATFYSVALPNMTYKIVSNVADMPSNSSYWLNNGDFKINSNTSTTTVAADNEKSLKRKFSENEENEDEAKTTLTRN
jgi:hypothetical protein